MYTGYFFLIFYKYTTYIKKRGEISPLFPFIPKRIYFFNELQIFWLISRTLASSNLMTLRS